MTNKCEHENFAANVAVARLTREDGGSVYKYTADVTIKCADCDTPFHFVGLPAGILNAAPSVSVDGLEARIPIGPGRKFTTNGTFRVEMPVPANTKGQ